jgi:two-component system KDP operon response regulator KdpE
MTRVLVVDDEPQIVRALRINLTARGYQVLTAADGAAALRAAAEGHPDVVVLDLGLPDLDGAEVIAGLRGWSSVPIIVLSARTDSSDKVAALDAGADDYITKPFGMDELLARLRAAVRRSVVGAGADEPVVTTPPFTVDLAAKKVHRGGGEVHLTEGLSVPTHGISGDGVGNDVASRWMAGRPGSAVGGFAGEP